MEIIYRAFDGTEFRTKDSCAQYERNNAGLKGVHMWNVCGKSVDESHNAYFLHLDDEEESAKAFIAMSESDDGYYDGIEDGDTGWYYWDDYNERYVFMEGDIIRAFARAVNEYENTK